MAEKRSLEDSMTYDTKALFVINAKNGEILACLDDRLFISGSTLISNKQIIQKKNSGDIVCLDFNFNLIKSYFSRNADALSVKLLANEFYIVEIKKTHINVISRLSAQPQQIQLSASEVINSAEIQGDILICGLKPKGICKNSLIMINMKESQILAKYPIKELYEHHEGLYTTSISYVYGSIQSIAMNEKYAFIAHERGKVILLDLKTHETKLIKNFACTGRYTL